MFIIADSSTPVIPEKAATISDNRHFKALISCDDPRSTPFEEIITGLPRPKVLPSLHENPIITSG